MPEPGELRFHWNEAVSILENYAAPGDIHVQERPVPPEPGLRIKTKSKQEISENSTVGEYFDITLATPLTNEVCTKLLELRKDLISEYPYKFRDSKIHVGIEVEVENVLVVDPNLLLLFWTMHGDGSLRNRGKEFKTFPIQLQYLEPALNQLYKGFNRDVEFSNRTSVHVHLDMTKLSMKQALGCLFTYAAVENLLFKFASPQRRKNIFCVPITESVLFSLPYGKIDLFLKDAPSFWHKYTAMNILPLHNFGTFEFRHMPGTNDIHKLLIWVDLLSHLRIYAYKFSLEEIISKISSLNTSSKYLQFLEEIFEDLVPYLDLSGLVQDMEKPCYIVKNCSVANSFNKKVNKSKIETHSSLGKILNNSSEKLLSIFSDDMKEALFYINEGQYGLIKRREESIDQFLGRILEIVNQHINEIQRDYPEIYNAIYLGQPFSLEEDLVIEDNENI